MKRIIAAALFAAATACLAQSPAPADPKPARPPRPPPGARELGVIMSYMPGTYESIDHAKGPPGAGTRMRIAPMWTERKKLGEFWFYVEHAPVEDDSKPFRQRIYRFSQEKRKFSAHVFALPGDKREFVNEWKKEEPFERFKPEDLREYEGCRLEVGHMTMMFWARTEGKSCRAENPDAAHEFTEMFVSNAGMQNGEQAYGPEGRLIAGHPGVWDFRRIGPVRPAKAQ